MHAHKHTELKYKRLEARITADQKDLFQRAADLLGRSLTDFMVSTLQEAAFSVIQEHQIVHLSLRDQKAFVAAILTPPKPGKALVKAAKRYKKAVKAEDA